jgi:RNA polymerase sigma-70 factor (ECF subfamily)
MTKFKVPPAADLQALGEASRELRAAFERAIAEHRTALWRYCLHLTGSAWEAEDLAQETVLKGLGALYRFGQTLQPRAYLFRIASNTWIDQQRRARPQVDLEAAQEIPADDTPERSLELSEAMEVLVTTLPPRQRVVLLLIDAFGFAAKEVAAMLRITEGAAKAVLHRARHSLRRARTAPADSGTARTAAAPAVVAAYLDAFNRRDAEALAALFDPEATNYIVGDWEEHGVETMKQYSLAFWKAEPQPERAQYRNLLGRDVVVVTTRRPDGSEALWSVIELELGAERVTGHRWYFFCPELLEHAAAQLGMPAVNHGYCYEGPASAG